MRALLPLASVLLAVGCEPAALPHPAVGAMLEAPHIVAQQCGSAEAPGNTLEGCGAAREAGADMLGVDVWLSSDGLLILANSPTLEDFTDGQGDLETYTLAELQELDAAWQWSPRQATETDPDEVRFPLRGSGYSIPQLDDLLLEDSPLLISVARPHEAMVAALRDTLEGRDPARFCLWSETSAGADALSRALPGACIAFPEPDLRCLDWTQTLPLDWGACPSWSLIVSEPLAADGRLRLREALVRASERRGWPVIAETGEDPYTTELMMLLGVHGVFTATPAEALAIRQRIQHEL